MNHYPEYLIGIPLMNPTSHICQGSASEMPHQISY